MDFSKTIAEPLWDVLIRFSEKWPEKVDFQKGKSWFQMNLMEIWISVQLKDPWWGVLLLFFQKKNNDVMLWKK